MYSALVGMLALMTLFMIVKKKKTNGIGMYILMVSSAVVGSAPLIQQILIPLLNGVINAVSNMVFGQAVEGGGGVYSAAVLGVCLALLVFIWWDKNIVGWELPAMIIACMAIGTTSLVTSWLPDLLNGTAGAIA
mgnify:CR=1 FL=1